MMDSAALFRTIENIKETLRLMAESGCRGFDCSPRCLDMMAGWGRPAASARESLTDIREELGDCRRCRLHLKRTHIVFGEGDPHARLVFVGEGPGFEEDRRGQVFVGAAGQLLTRIIQAIGLSRKQVYIGNIIKCRPPGNRNPEADEIDACFPFLERQIAAIRPRFVCALGSFAARALLRTDTPISKLRGRFHDYGAIKLMPTYHPAYLLRNPAKKRETWEDMKQLMAAMQSDEQNSP